MRKGKESFEEALQEDFLRERAAVLSRAAAKLEASLRRLACVEKALTEDAFPGQVDLQTDVFNQILEEARSCRYDLIVTREAMGLRNHRWVDACYPIPMKKKKSGR